MKRLALLPLVGLLLCAGTATLEADELPPFHEHLIPPELIMGHQSEIGLTQDQRSALKQALYSAQMMITDLQWNLEPEKKKMAELLQASPIDSAAVVSQAQKLMAIEHEIKIEHLKLLVQIKNVLTEEQAQKLMQIRSQLPPRAPGQAPGASGGGAPVPPPPKNRP
jgi:Spy/CpxP family protein refolding chaperone